jgi:hypothetical protein
MCEEKKSHLDEIKVNPKQADLIAYRVSKHLNVKTPQIIFTGKTLRRTRGTYYNQDSHGNFLNLIKLHKTGECLMTLLHELTHTVAFHHKQSFWYQFHLLIDFWEVVLIKDKKIREAFKLGKQPKEKKEKPMTETKRFKYVMEILEGEIINKTIKMSIIGKTLAEEGINNRDNILKIQNIFKKKGIRITK